MTDDRHAPRVGPGARDAAVSAAAAGRGAAGLGAYHRSMIIAVDCGNSAVKVALVESASPSDVTRLESATATEADLRSVLNDLSVAAARPAVPAVVAVSVADRWSDRLARAAEAVGLDLTVVAASMVPIRTGLVRPDQTGPDRLLAAWAAWRLHGEPLIVVGLGTATTVDAVDGDGFFLGGAIMPGPGLAADSLAEGTSRLPRVELALPSDAIGTDTLSALRSGIVFGHVGAIRELAARMRLRLGASARVVITGGHSLAPWARSAFLEATSTGSPAVAQVIDPDLVLKGLGLFAEQGRASPAGGPRPGGFGP